MRMRKMGIKTRHNRGNDEAISQEILFQAAQLKRHAAGIYGLGSFLVKARNKIMNINKSNLNDLDALYFFDKVDMTINQSSPTQIIPILPLNKTLNIKTSTNKPKVLNEKNIKIK